MQEGVFSGQKLGAGGVDTDLRRHFYSKDEKGLNVGTCVQVKG
jgi:hypothetical protein